MNFLTKKACESDKNYQIHKLFSRFYDFSRYFTQKPLILACDF